MLSETRSQIKMSLGIPIKVLHEAEGHIITCETTDGKSNRIENAFQSLQSKLTLVHDFHPGVVYRGKLIEAEDSMNLQMSNITVTNRDGSVTGMQSCFLRGSKIMYVVMPDILKHAPVFNKATTKSATTHAPSANILKARGRGLGRGRPVGPKRKYGDT